MNVETVNWDSWIATWTEQKVSKQNVISVCGKKLVILEGHVGTRVKICMLEGRYEVYANDTLVETFETSPGQANAAMFVERVIAKAGTFKYKRRTYYVGCQHAGKAVRVQEAANGKDVLVFHDDDLLDRKAITDGSVY